MDLKKLYSKLERIEKLEEIIFERGEKKKLKIGDEHVIEYNGLVDSIPTLLSLKDLRGYHIFLGEKTEDLLKEKLYKQKEELEEKLGKQKEELEEKLGKQEGELERNLYKQKKEILGALKGICSPDVYSKIESVIEDVYFNMTTENN